MEQSERPRLSPDVFRGYAEFAGVKFSVDQLERIIPRVERYLKEIKRLEEIDVGEVEPAIIFSIKQSEK